MGRSVLSDVCNGMSLHTPHFPNCGIFRGPTFSKNFLQEWFQLKGKTHPKLNCLYVPKLDSLLNFQIFTSGDALPEGLKDRSEGSRGLPSWIQLHNYLPLKFVGNFTTMFS